MITTVCQADVNMGHTNQIKAIRTSNRLLPWCLVVVIDGRDPKAVEDVFREEEEQVR